MKVINHLFAVAAACVLLGVMLAGCCQSPDKISSYQIKKMYNKELKDAATNVAFDSIKIGYYETDATTRCELRRLEAAGLVKVEFERFVWWEKITRTKKVVSRSFDWWYGESVSTSYRTIVEYENPDHILARVTLTPEGEKLVVKELPEAKAVEDKDMKQPDVDLSEFPENKVQCEENWPEIPNPFLQKEEPKAEPQPKDEPVEDVLEEEIVEKEEPADPNETVERIDQARYEAYQKAVETVNDTTVVLKSYETKAVKARNIQIRNVDGISIATAEVILEVQNVTLAGRAISKKVEGTRISKTVVYTYFLDKGWVSVDQLKRDNNALKNIQPAIDLQSKTMENNGNEEQASEEADNAEVDLKGNYERFMD